MKMKHLSALTFALLSTVLWAGVSLEKSYNNSCSVSKINATDYKYFVMDDVNNQCRIYNLDHSVYKTINLSIPNNMYLYDIKYVSQDLFDDDSKIELLYVYYEYIATSSTEGYYKYYTKVINEDGTTLINQSNAIYSDIKEVNDNEYRLFIYSYDYSSWPYNTNTYIYSFDGYPNVLKSEDISARSISIGDAYPNPAQDFVKLPYSLESSVASAQLVIHHITGEQIKSFEIDQQFSFLKVTTNNFHSGQYVYYIESNGQRTEGGKFLIQ